MKKFDQINIIPFIDIMLVLLAIVLITATFISQGKIEVKVPVAESSKTMESEDLSKLLTVKADGQLFFNDEPIELTKLAEIIKTWEPTQKVTLKVDSDAKFQDFVSLTDLMLQHNIDNVSIVTLQKEKD